MKTRRRTEGLPAGVELDLVAACEGVRVALGCDGAVDRLASLLGQGRRHPVLVGPPEVGKTALVRGLARRIRRGVDASGVRAIWQVSLRTLDGLCGKDDVVGKRLAELIDAAAAAPVRTAVYVRDLWCLRRYDAEHELAAALAHVPVPFLGEAWPNFATWLAENADLGAVTHVVRVEEATRERTRELLRLEGEELLRREGIVCEDAALARLVRYAERLLPGRRFPGKAFALLDEAAREASADLDRRVTSARVTSRVCESLRLPRFLVDPDTPLDVDHLVAYLRERVVGQDDAVDAIAQCVALHKADLTDRHRPLGVVLLAGPAGVGKTLLARLVAEYVFGSAERLVRVPMGEHGEDWKVDQLFGQRGASSPEGRRGSLARRLAGKPFAVLLLDEIEKASPLAFRHLLRPLDEGAYVNGNDEEVVLRNALVILTTSVGAEIYRGSAVGFGVGAGTTSRAASVRKALADAFPFELLDRVDRISVCPPLGDGDVREVARREVQEMLSRGGVVDRGLDVQVDDEVIERIVGECGEHHGVRALRRALERHVVRPLAAYILRMRPPAGARLRVAAHDDAVVPLEVPPTSSRAGLAPLVPSLLPPAAEPAIAATASRAPRPKARRR